MILTKLKGAIPDFFIMGAPQCGTTSVYSYLASHPQVFMPKLKEPQFFCTDFPRLAQINGMNAYKKLFASAPAGCVTGEGSVWYLFSEVAAKNILRLTPCAKFIIVLRNPIDAAAALHMQFLRSGKENQFQFEEAWHLQFDRRRGRSLPAYCPEPRCLQYRQVFSYAPQLERLREIVRPSQIKVYVFEEIFADPRSFYLDLLAFLEVDDDHRQSFELENANRTFRARSFGEWLAGLPVRTRERLTAVGKAAQATGVRPAELFLLAATPRRRQPLRKEFRRYLAAEFASDVERLERLLARPLLMWRGRDRFFHLSTEEGEMHHRVTAAHRQEKPRVGLSALEAGGQPHAGGAS